MSELVSVIIPVYNSEKYLSGCLDSVLAQTYKDIEVIAVDDGSSDGSPDLLARYAAADERVRVLKKNNGGASSARNMGISDASGDYVFFVDSDDNILPETIETLHADAVKNGSDLVFYDMLAVDEKTGRTSKTNYGHTEKYAPGSGIELMRRMVANKDFHTSVVQLFYKKSFLDRTALRFEEGIIYEDYLFTCAAFCLADRVSYVPEYLYSRLYRADSVMTSVKMLRNYLSAEKVYYMVCDFSGKNGDVVPNAYIVRGAYNVITCYEALNDAEKAEAADRFSQVKKHILENGAFGDAALKMRCYAKPLWAAARAAQKLFGRSENKK